MRDRGAMDSRHRHRRRSSSARRASGEWRTRATVLCLLLPLIAVSCVAGPDRRSRAVEHTEPVHPLPPAPAYFHFLRGYLAELGNDSPTALDEYRAALDVDPESVVLRVQLAALQFVSGAMTQAAVTLDDVPRDQVHDAVVLTKMAKIYEGAGQPDLALALYEDAIRVKPDEGAPYFAKGVLLLNLRHAPQAEAVFTRGLAHAPQSHLGYFYRGKALEVQEKTAGAKEEYRRAISLAEHFAPAYQALAGLHEAEGDIQGAIQVYERFVSLGTPRDSNLRHDFVRLLLRHKRYTRALEVLDHMIADDPGDMNARIRRAMVHVETNDSRRAIADLTRLIRAHPSDLRVRDYLGWVYEQADDLQKAMAMYRANIEKDATFYDSHVHLGLLLYRLNRFEESTPHLIRAVALNPGNAETHLLLGLSYLRMEQFAHAQSAFAKGLDHHPTDEDLRFNLGATYDKLGRFPDVVREMEAVLALNPDHADALNYLGYSYADRGIKGEEAVALTRHAVSLKPDNGAYIDSLGWALFKVGRVAEALEVLKRAIELVNDDPVMFEHLGAIYLTQRHREKAQQAWIRSLALDPENETLIRRFREVGFGTPPHLSNRSGAPSDDQARVRRSSGPAFSGVADPGADVGRSSINRITPCGLS